MFAQFFGGYLFNHKLCTAEDLTQAFEAKKHTRLRLGVLAINAGLMTAEQVEHVNITQQSVDKRFGDLAVELGYVTADDVEKLLAQQPTDYLLLGQTLVNNGALTNAEFEKALKDYKAENQPTIFQTIKQKLYITLSMSSIILTMMKMLVSVLIMLLCFSKILSDLSVTISLLWKRQL